MASLASSLVAVDLKSSYRRVTVDLLSEGSNRALAVDGKVFFFVRSESVAPLYYLLCDSNQSCFVLSVYGVHTDVIKEGDQLTLLDPYFRDVDLSWKEKGSLLNQLAIANESLGGASGPALVRPC